MKTVENKKFSYSYKEWDEEISKIVEKPKEVSYFQLINECVNKPSVQSQNPQFTYDDIVSIDRVKKALEGKIDTVEFEDEDFKFIQKQVANTTWAISKYEFVEFMDYIKSV